MPAFRAYILAFYLLTGILLPVAAFTQNSRIDSMERALRHPKDDTARIALLFNLAQEYYGYDTAKGMQYLEAGNRQAKKMHYLYEMADYYEMKAKLLMDVSPASVMTLLDTAISYYERNAAGNISPQNVAASKLSIATCKSQKGIILGALGKYREAIAVYLDAVDAWKASDEPNRNEAIANYYGSISSIYIELKQPEKALEYDEAAIVYRLRDGNEELLAMTYFYVSDDFVWLSRPDSAFHYVQLAEPLAQKLRKPKLSFYLYTRKAKIFLKQKLYDQAAFYYALALKEAHKTGDLSNNCRANRALGECYLAHQDYDRARRYLLVALSIALTSNLLKEKLEILKDLVQVEDQSHHPALAYAYLKQVDQLNDSLKTIESKAAVAEIENKYQATQKEKEIIQLQKDKQIQTFSIRQQSTLNYVLVASLAALSLLSFLIYRNYRQKQQLQQQKINELEKDQKLMAVDAMLKGQEEERSRLARDLHDGIGGLLSGIRYSLYNMKGNLLVTPDNMAVFERSLDMIDTSIMELRRVAHNMMPEMLVKFGLDEALKEYCHTVNAAHLVAVKYQSFGMGDRVDSTLEIIVYRIVQELVANVIKHAGATETLVQLVREQSRLSVLVEDNGRGFHVEALEESKGAGWTNIRSRVSYLKGRLDINSAVNTGTSVSIEFNI